MLLRIINHKLQPKPKRRRILLTTVSSQMLKTMTKRRKKTKKFLTSRILEKTSRKVGIWPQESKRLEKSVYLQCSMMMIQIS